ncbi:MAG TPA: DinB family protein [Woeseiaceae bacterium]|nr:DinB family protein [Woeseiaceae bacterium]
MHLRRQFDTAWKLAGLHLSGLTTDECLWRPANKGLHVQQDADGHWRADWPEHEGYDLGPPSIAWLSWHIIFWWSTVLDQSFAAAQLTRDEVLWPGTAESVRARLNDLHDQWCGQLAHMTAGALASSELTRWPFKDRPFGDVVAWVNLELTKNAAEIGYARFLYAVRGTGHAC